MAGKMIPIVFKGLPCEIIPLFFKLDGTFPNHEPNPLESKNLRDLQKKSAKPEVILGLRLMVMQIDASLWMKMARK